MKSAADFESLKVANFLPKEIFHPKIANPAWLGHPVQCQVSEYYAGAETRGFRYAKDHHGAGATASLTQFRASCRHSLCIDASI
jgi:hypothetical protein